MSAPSRMVAAFVLAAALGGCSREQDPAAPASGAETAPSSKSATAPASRMDRRLQPASAAALTETEKIERLISAVAGLEGAKFIRNGSDHTPKEAAEHLRSKWKSAGGKVKTAVDFIDGVASKSSMSGKPYQVRLADGRTMNAGDFLRERLAAIESGK